MAAPYMGFVLKASAAVTAGDAGAYERHAILRETPATDRALYDLQPPDLALFELTRQAIRIWAQAADELRRDRWASVVSILSDACVSADAEAADPEGRARRHQQELRVARMNAARGRS